MWYLRRSAEQFASASANFSCKSSLAKMIGVLRLVKKSEMLLGKTRGTVSL